MRKNKMRSFDLELILTIMSGKDLIDEKRYRELDDMLEYLTSGKIWDSNYDMAITLHIVKTYLATKYPKLASIGQSLNKEYWLRFKTLIEIQKTDIFVLEPIPLELFESALLQTLFDQFDCPYTDEELDIMLGALPTDERSTIDDYYRYPRVVKMPFRDSQTTVKVPQRGKVLDFDGYCQKQK